MGQEKETVLQASLSLIPKGLCGATVGPDPGASGPELPVLWVA